MVAPRLIDFRFDDCHLNKELSLAAASFCIDGRV